MRFEVYCMMRIEGSWGCWVVIWLGSTGEKLIKIGKGASWLAPGSTKTMDSCIRSYTWYLFDSSILWRYMNS
jgi:hypothetical protein